jgi:hypothetical protein
VGLQAGNTINPKYIIKSDLRNNVETCGTHMADIITPIKPAPSKVPKGMMDGIVQEKIEVQARWKNS